MAAADAPAAPPDGLTLAGAGATTREVHLTRDATGLLAGRVSFLLRNTADQVITVSVRYFPDRPQPAVTLSRTSEPFALTRTLRIKPGSVGVLALRARLEARSQPSDLDGTLLVTALGQPRADGPVTLGSLEVRATGVLGSPTGVSFEPGSVALQVTRGVWFHASSGDRTTVRLRGPGVARLVAELGELPAGASGKGPAPAATLLLSNDSGHQTLVELRDVKALGPDLASVTLATQGSPSPGSYVGTLPLAPGTSAGPTLDVKVRSQVWFPITALLVFAASLLGGLLPQLTALARIKAALKRELRDLLNGYERLRGAGEPASWDLSDRLGEKPWFDRQWAGLPGEGGVAELWTNITSANSEQNLNDDTASLISLRGAIQRWLNIEPEARALRDARARVPVARGTYAWQETQVWKDTDLLLKAVEDEPKDDEDYAELRRRLRNQTRFHVQFASAWAQFAELEKRFTVEQRHAVQKAWDAADVDVINTRLAKKPEAERDRGARDKFNQELEQAIGALAELQGLLTGNGHSQQLLERAPAEPLLLPAGASPVEAAVAQAPAAVVAGVAAGGQATAPAPAAIAPVAAGSVDTDGADAPSPRRRPLAFVSRLWDAYDWGLTFAIAFVTVVAYMLPLYTGTWGSWQDWLTAFAAGFLGQVAIKWALMPIFHSRRIRSPGTQ